MLFGFGRSSHIFQTPKAGSLLGTSSETLARVLRPQIPDKDRAPLPNEYGRSLAQCDTSPGHSEAESDRLIHAIADPFLSLKMH